MVRKKQVNNENRAVLNRDFPRRGRSLVSVPEAVRRLYPNVKIEYLEEALALYKGQRFDDGDSTTDAFGKVLAAVIIDVAVEGGMTMGIIEDLWHGNISPNERFFGKDSEYAAVLHEVLRHSKDLQNRLNDEESEILEKLTESANEMCSIGERDAFVRGFTLGARIIIEVMNTEME